MASAFIHCHGTDVSRAHLYGQDQPAYSFISISLGDDVGFVLPHGARGPAFARALAAVILHAADDHEAILQAHAHPASVGAVDHHAADPGTPAPRDKNSSVSAADGGGAA